MRSIPRQRPPYSHFLQLVVNASREIIVKRLYYIYTKKNWNFQVDLVSYKWNLSINYDLSKLATIYLLSRSLLSIEHEQALNAPIA